MELVHVANVLLLLSFAARDILKLRVLSALACLVLLGLAVDQGAWGPAAWWNLLFVGLNVFHIGWLLYERRPVQLSADEARLLELAFPTATPRAFAQLLNGATWEWARPGEDLFVRGQVVDEVLVVLDGDAIVRSGRRTVAALGPGAFLGEMSLLSDQPLAAADVIAAGPVRYLRWSIPVLERQFALHPELRLLFQQSVGVDLVRKLKAA